MNGGFKRQAYLMLSQKLVGCLSKRLGGFSGVKAYIGHVEVLKKRRNAVTL
jgi:hypothetical protein